MKILVIDDDHMVRYALSKILQRNGYDVITASDGKRGMALLRDELPEVVITDIIMPEQEGIETAGLLNGTSRKGRSSRVPGVAGCSMSIFWRWRGRWATSE